MGGGSVDRQPRDTSSRAADRLVDDHDVPGLGGGTGSCRPPTRMTDLPDITLACVTRSTMPGTSRARSFAARHALCTCSTADRSHSGGDDSGRHRSGEHRPAAVARRILRFRAEAPLAPCGDEARAAGPMGWLCRQSRRVGIPRFSNATTSARAGTGSRKVFASATAVFHCAHASCWRHCRIRVSSSRTRRT